MIMYRSALSIILAAIYSSSELTQVSAQQAVRGPLLTSSPASPARSLQQGNVNSSNKGSVMYEVWGSDQSNSVDDEDTPGVKGSYLWIWDSDSIQAQLAGGSDAVPLGCTPDVDQRGPCNLLDVFPRELVQSDTDNKLEDLERFGRLHGMIKDPLTQRYINANIFAPGGGYIGIIDAETKEAVALFRVTKTGGTATERGVHMSFWKADGSAIIIGNLYGKMVERIKVKRNGKGDIIDLIFEKDAGVYLGSDFELKEEATFFRGHNAFGRELIGRVRGSYDDADTGNYTPTGKLKESDCTEDPGDIPEGGCRPNNAPICPIPSLGNNGYFTLAGGGLFVAKLDTTPMQIVGEYGDAVLNGAGCAGVETGGIMYLTGGVSASGSGADQSTFTLYGLEDALYDENKADPKENSPMPIQVFKDIGNTNTLGNIDGTETSNTSGQLPSSTTRRDSHGAAITLDGKYIHVDDRIGNVVEVFDSETHVRVNTYDLVSLDGKSGREGPHGPCRDRSVLDDRLMPLNDPAPDLMEITPDGKYLMIAFRGPVPITVNHGAQGSCPGVGIVEITEEGKSGKLVDVLRSTNTYDTATVPTLAGGHQYTGAERSDVHGSIVVSKLVANQA